MDNRKMLKWMEMIELLVYGAREYTADVNARLYSNARNLRCELATETNCASVTDRPDTPPPSSWPSVSRIRKETRDEVLAEVHRVLNDAKTAQVIWTALRLRDDYSINDILVGASAFIAGHMGKSE